MSAVPDALLDADILIKLTAYDLLRAAQDQLGAVGALGVSRFVVLRALERRQGLTDSKAASERWQTSVATIQLIEPTEEEVRLATDLEDDAIAAGVPLDTGESQLCAIAICRGIDLLLTGDKRAIAAAESTAHRLPQLLRLSGRLMCLEQLVSHLVGNLGAEKVKQRVCAEPSVDRSLSVCLSCWNDRADTAFDLAGLNSYIEDLRASAPKLLWRGES